MADEREERSGLDTALDVWIRRKLLAIVGFVLPMTAALGLITFLPNIYRSTATVLVDRQQIPETLVQSTVTSALETRLHTISQEVLSRARLEALIDRFDLYGDLRTRVPREVVIQRTRKDIKLELKGVQVRGRGEATVAFTISYQGVDPNTVSAVTNTLASFYVEEDLKARERQATGTADFLKTQLEETKRRLDEQEQKVSAFKRRHLGELPQQMDSNLAALERLHSQLRINADSQTRATERRQTLSSQRAEIESLLASQGSGGVAAGGGFVSADSPEARLGRAQQDLVKLRTQYTEKHPDVVQLVAEVAALEREVAEVRARDGQAAREAGRAPAASSTGHPSAPLSPYVLRVKEALNENDADLKVLKGEEKRLRDAIATYQARVDQIPRREQEFVELSRDYESTRELYRSLMKRHDEAQIAESMEQRQKGEQFRLLDAAVPSNEPAAPARAKLLLVALLGSLGVAVAAVMAAERIDRSFHSVEELRSYSGEVPVLVSIPWIATRRYLRLRHWRMRLATGTLLLAVTAILGASYLVAHGNERLVALLARGGS